MKSFKWVYDDSGFYSYILLNGPSDLFDGVQKILYQKKISILLSGSSFRPASNGNQYDWYIRINQSNAPYHVVKDIFSQITYRDIPFQEESESYTELPPWELEGLFEETSQITIEELTEVLQQKQLEINELQQFKESYQKLAVLYQNKSNELEEIREWNNQLETDCSNMQARLRQLTYENEKLKQFHQKYLKARAENKTLREENRQLQAKLSTADRSSSTSRDLVETNLELQRKLTKKDEELNQWVDEYEAENDKKDVEINQWVNEVQKQNKHITTLENQKAHLLYKNRQLNEHLHDSSNKIGVSSNKTTSGEPLFQTTLRVFAKNIKFLGGSLQILWQEIENPDRILEDLAKLNTLKGERVESLHGWLERRYNDWRLYYQFHGDGQCRVLIAAKKTQKHDIEWLKGRD
ncbi:MAG: hypothetical protein KDJ52_33510 [Anaerolineae bacterium]|nr:hypothetical protein [Anaerolineae bacterium]